MSYPSNLSSQIRPSQLPQLGVGLGLRRSLFEETMANRDKIDWLEIVPENYMGKGGRSREMLELALDKGFPIISHGVNLSIGSADPLDETYLTDMAELFSWVKPAWFSDHLCFTSIDGVYLNDLIPLPFTKEVVDHVVKRIKTIQSRFEMPFLIENVSYYASLAPGAEMDEAQFLSEILERSDCGLMLDVNNVYVNAQNHGYDAIDFLNRIPLERTVQIHIAGHLRRKHMIIDTHGASVCPEVYDILEEVLRRIPVNGILLERDLDIPPMSELLDELVQIRRIVERVGRTHLTGAMVP